MNFCICGHGEAYSLGVIPDCEEFSVKKYYRQLQGGDLWQCIDCGSILRHTTLYEKLPNSLWVEVKVERNDMNINTHI